MNSAALALSSLFDSLPFHWKKDMCVYYSIWFISSCMQSQSSEFSAGACVDMSRLAVERGTVQVPGLL